jgi:hypothetical protein
MANLVPDPTATFRYINLIDNLSESQLKEKGYYTGYACPHGHFIRDTTGHWCYHCTNKILSNVCGFDINYMHQAYKSKYAALWKKVQIGFPEDCWSIASPTGSSPKRVCLPSYRSDYSQKRVENVNVHKALYQCAWGDVGSLIVTRTCGNTKCGNPLHMVSSWNRVTPPQHLHPFDIEFKAEKLMLYARQINTGKSIRPVVEKQYKHTITHPLDVKEVPDYDEGG